MEPDGPWTTLEVPSPQLMVMDETVPSLSAAEKETVTTCPVFDGLGMSEDIETVGGRSFTVSVAVPEPGPAEFVAVTVIVNV